MSNHIGSTPLATAFFNLPKEVRDEIYGNLFSCGDLSIMRVSKSLHSDSALSFRHNAIFRVKFPFVGTVSTSTMRNIEIKIDFYGHYVGGYARSIEVHELGMFLKTLQKASLRVILFNIPFVRHRDTLRRLFGWLSYASLLETVTIEIKNFEPGRKGEIYPFDARVEKARNSIALKEIELMVEPILGTSTRHITENPADSYINFRPQRRNNQLRFIG